MKKSAFASITLALAAPLLAANVHAQAFGKADDAVQYRQGAFQIIKAHFGALQPVVKGQVAYDQAAVLADVEILDQVSNLPWKAFGPGTEGGKARDDIWLDEEGFKAAQKKYLDSLGPLTAAAKAGNLDQLKKAFADTGASCKACHDSFRD
ncbi:MAG: cytochrome c [Burkholderiaceae bacterium]|nr:cytochrome c [Burkholderiaceae bacterium]MCD8518081.1 cytochrome c [Burkholderiaceae bacterium]MCD8537017.1 cytochrome c [Burkholderiaceae bacterium]MCD8565117.1 cytochrome c [Burkholderiaceae bacterium]